MCLIVSLLTGSVNPSNSFSSHQANPDDSVFSSVYQLTGNNMIASILLTAFAVLGILAFVLLIVAFLCWGILVSPILTVGQCRYMLINRSQAPSLGVLFSGFTRSYWNTVAGMFHMNLRIFLYSLLLFIPGVVKTYQYLFVPYLLAENPDLDPARAAEISTLMSDGEKWNCFVLDLSFLGWFLLGFLLFGVGSLFVNPYYEATKAELYAAMRAKVLASGYVTEAELSGQSY